MTKYVAFFDLDHTILNVSSGRIMFKGSCLHKLIGRKEIYEAIIMIILNRMGILSEESAIERSLRWYRGMSGEMFTPTISPRSGCAYGYPYRINSFFMRSD